jgi:hypothetical protein
MDSTHTILQLHLDSTGWLSQYDEVFDAFASRIAFRSVLFAIASMFDILALDFGVSQILL